MKWKSIKSAPKDRVILVCGGLYESELGSPHDNNGTVKVIWEAESNYDSDTEKYNGSWQIVDTCYYSIEIIKPTHWQELPKPIAELEGGK